jgi:hypothetical protein
VPASASRRTWRDLLPYQLWRFLVVNVKILRGVIHSKRLSPFVIKYKVSYVPEGGDHPITVANVRIPPQAGDRVRLARHEVEITEVHQLVPPHGEFCSLQAGCRILESPSDE